MTDSLVIFGDTFDDVTGIKATDDNDNTLIYIRPTGTKSISENGTGIDVAAYSSVDVNVPSSGGITINDVPNATGITAEIISGGVTPSETWETLYENATVGYYYDSDNTYPYCWISTLGDTPIISGSEWRITFDGVVYRCTATYDSVMGGFYFIGNPKYSNGTDDGSDAPFCFYNTGYGAWSGSADKLNIQDTTQTASVKIERLVTS